MGKDGSLSLMHFPCQSLQREGSAEKITRQEEHILVHDGLSGWLPVSLVGAIQDKHGDTGVTRVTLGAVDSLQIPILEFGTCSWRHIVQSHRVRGFQEVGMHLH